MSRLYLAWCSANVSGQSDKKTGACLPLKILGSFCLFSSHVLLHLHWGRTLEGTLSSCDPLSLDRPLVCYQILLGWPCLAVGYSLQQWLVQRLRQQPTKETTNRLTEEA